jgi:hypothetical protein
MLLLLLSALFLVCILTLHVLLFNNDLINMCLMNVCHLTNARYPHSAKITEMWFALSTLQEGEGYTCGSHCIKNHINDICVTLFLVQKHIIFCKCTLLLPCYASNQGLIDQVLWWLCNYTIKVFYLLYEVRIAKVVLPQPIVSWFGQTPMLICWWRAWDAVVSYWILFIPCI